MKTNPFTALKNLSDELLPSLRQKYPLVLNGLAVSVLSEKDFRRSLKDQKNFKRIYFTKDELLYCKSRISSLAGRFAAKIAINEALQKQIPWKDINILSLQTGEPVPSFSGNTHAPVSISISHEKDLITAFAASPTGKNNIAVGIDAASIARISTIMPQTKIMKKILTPRELGEIKNLPSNMAEKWSGKEAVSKAIGIGIWHGASLQEIEILTHKGKPLIRLHGKVLEKAKTKGLSKWTLNYINNKKFVLAFAIASF